MSIKNIPVKLSISRPSSNTREDYINLTLTDAVSNIEFFDGEFSLSDFMSALTGFALQPGVAEVRWTEHLGKKYEREGALLTVSNADLKAAGIDQAYGNSERIAEYLRQRFPREGWELDGYLGSQNSIRQDYKTSMWTFNVSYYRYVPVENQPNGEAE